MLLDNCLDGDDGDPHLRDEDIWEEREIFAVTWLGSEEWGMNTRHSNASSTVEGHQPYACSAALLTMNHASMNNKGPCLQ